AARVASAPPSAVASTRADPGVSSYAVIASRNLFNPARSETLGSAAASVSKPILHGVVLDGAKSRAFLEDPGAKRVAGYSVGDTISGGRIQRISDDRVVIARPEGLLEVLLQDPGKPRPAPTSGAPGSPTLPSPQTAPGVQAPQGPQVPTVGQAPPAGPAAPPQGPVIGAPPAPATLLGSCPLAVAVRGPHAPARADTAPTRSRRPGIPHAAAVNRTLAQHRVQLRQCRRGGGHPGGRRDRRLQLRAGPGGTRSKGDGPDHRQDRQQRRLQCAADDPRRQRPGRRQVGQPLSHHPEG